MKKTFTREELYDLVWSESILQLAKRFNISNVGLKKTCKRMNIPTPKTGYWAKKRHGHKVHQEKLPKGYKGKVEVTLEELDIGVDGKQHRLSKLNILQKQIEKEHKHLLRVAKRLNSPDKLIEEIQNSVKDRKYRAYNGLIDVQWFGVFDLKVSSTHLSRALRILNTLIGVLQERGHIIVKGYRHTSVEVFGSEISISMREKLKRREKQDFWGNPYEPRGILAIFVDRWSNTEYKDGKQPLEVQIPRIIAMIELKGEEERIRREEYEEEQRQEEIRRKKHEELEDKKDAELVSFRSLLLNSERWHKAENLRNYIDEYEEKAQPNDVKLQDWLAWARRKADWYDPFINAEDQLLGEVSKEELSRKRIPFTDW